MTSTEGISHTLPKVMLKVDVLALNAFASQFLMPSQKPY